MPYRNADPPKNEPMPLSRPSKRPPDDCVWASQVTCVTGYTPGVTGNSVGLVVSYISQIHRFSDIDTYIVIERRKVHSV